MYNMLLEISTELDSIKAMLQKSESTHLLDFQNFCYRQKKEMRSQKYYLSFNLTLSYCYELIVSRSIENHLGFDHMLDQMSDCLF